ATNQIGMLQSGTMITGELQAALDAKTAKVGDPIVLKTSSAVSQNGKVVIPEGVKLLGHVTEVQSGSASKIGFVFDKLQKGNQRMAVSAEVTSIKHGDGSVVTGGANTADSGLPSGGAGTGGSGMINTVTNTAGMVNPATGTLTGAVATGEKTVDTATKTVK